MLALTTRFVAPESLPDVCRPVWRSLDAVAWSASLTPSVTYTLRLTAVP